MRTNFVNNRLPASWSKTGIIISSAYFVFCVVKIIWVFVRKIEQEHEIVKLLASNWDLLDDKFWEEAFVCAQAW
jgi:hypothetical protein